jgi:hypothetical protein
MFVRSSALLLLVTLTAPPPQGDDWPRDVAPIARFLGDQGFGELAPDAPEATRAFGQLAGLWEAVQEMRTPAGGWEPSGVAIWAWKYDLGGFAVRDLWVQTADALPAYLAGLGRDYLLTSMRIFDAKEGRWRIAWMANGGGKSPGADFGTFEAVEDDGRIVMSSPPSAFGLQRVVFSEITEQTFLWQSQYSRDDGKTWQTVMRVRAQRLE